MEAQECRAGGSATAAPEDLGRGLKKALLCCTPAESFVALLSKPICHAMPVRACAPEQGLIRLAEVIAIILDGLLARF